MLEIKNYITGEVLHQVAAKSLSNADLRGINLERADFRGVDLEFADLSQANLSGARFELCWFRHAKFLGANLSNATFTNARLFDSNFDGSRLVSAMMSDAFFVRCSFRAAEMREANAFDTTFFEVDMREALLSGARLGNVSIQQSRLEGSTWNEVAADGLAFIRIEDLSRSCGLASVRHSRPAVVDRRTLMQSASALPDQFLEGCGYTPHEIAYLRALYTDSPIKYFSCFISHAEPDLPFADKLLVGLRASNVTCWHYKADMRGGSEWRDQIDAAIKTHDKLLLVCSRHAVYRPNVVREIINAIKAERETGRQKLFPIRLDDHILTAQMMDEAREKVRSGEWAENWVYYVQKLHVPDFSGWEANPAKYDEEFKKLLEALKASEAPAKP